MFSPIACFMCCEAGREGGASQDVVEPLGLS